MDTKHTILEWKGYAIGVFTFICSLILFYNWSDEMYYSAFGAFLFAAIIWGSYIVLRLIVLAFGSQDDS